MRFVGWTLSEDRGPRVCGAPHRGASRHAGRVAREIWADLADALREEGGYGDDAPRSRRRNSAIRRWTTDLAPRFDDRAAWCSRPQADGLHPRPQETPRPDVRRGVFVLGATKPGSWESSAFRRANCRGPPPSAGFVATRYRRNGLREAGGATPACPLRSTGVYPNHNRAD